jgi:hypothetical protein
MTAPELNETQPARRQVVLELMERGPTSLCGSWALYRSDDQTEQALIVAEPQPGVYLIEVYDLISDEPRAQRLVKLDELVKVDDEGGKWTFYDDHAAVRAAFMGVMA